MNNDRPAAGCRYALILFSTVALLSLAPAGFARDLLAPLAPRAVELQGYLGARLDQCITNRLLLHDTDSLVRNFYTRTQDVGGYHGEFIGKWLTGAALACKYKQNATLEAKMRQAADALSQSKSEEGYISTYAPAAYFRVWDIWIQKYVLLGLIAQYDQTGNQDYLNAAKASADFILERHGPGKLSIEEYGPVAHKGGVNFSILEPVVLLYERTGEKRYLDFARYIVESWSRPGKHSPMGARLLENAEAGVPVVESEILHCYVFMSCFEGVCEMYRATGDQRYLKAALKAARQIMREELTVVGSMGNHELWCSGAITQTAPLEHPMETCATATWIKLCAQLLRLTGDPLWADEMELSLYNALLGAMMPDGEWWSYASAIAGERLPSRVQGLNISCCVSSGPRALLLTPQWASMLSAEGDPVINLYSEGASTFKLGEGRQVKIVQETDYPKSGRVRLKIQPEPPTVFALKLRIPKWSQQTSLKVNGEAVTCTPGSYASIRRSWQPNDELTIDFDFRGRLLRAPSGAPEQAIMRGPIVLALDNRSVPEETQTLWLFPHPQPWLGPKAKDRAYILPQHNLPKAGEDAFVELNQVEPRTKGIQMAFEAPFVQRRAAFGYHTVKNLILCDYASAGNQWSSNNLYRVWMPQPLFLGSLYSKGNWKIQGGSSKRTSVPEAFRAVSRTPVE